MEQETRQEKERGIWSKLASGYDERTLKTYQEAYTRSIEKVVGMVSPDDEVLEIGCGTGIVTLGVAPYARRVVGTDISPEMIAVAQAKADREGVANVEFRVGDGYHHPEADGSFDVVLLFNLLHVVKEPETVLREAGRLLKPGGAVASATDCYGEPAPLRTRLMLGVQRVMKWMGIIPFMRYYQKQELHRLIEGCGFEVVEQDDLHPDPVNHYILAKKQS